MHTPFPRRAYAAALALAALTAVLAGCHQEVVVPRMGFVPESIALTQDKSDKTYSTYRVPGWDPALYTNVVVEPIQMYPEATAYINAQDAATVRELMATALFRAFGPNSVLGPAPAGPRTLVVHTAITEIRPNRPGLNIAPTSQIRGRGYGYASVEMFVRAGADGPVVAALASTVNTQRFSADKYTPMGTADEATKEWAQRLAALAK